MHADPGCSGGGRDVALEPSVVRDEILRRVAPVAQRERVALRGACGRVLAEPVAAAGLDAGCRIAAPELGCLAAAGVVEVLVYRRPRVAILCTGDELQALGGVLEAGQIFDSNRYLLHGLLARCGVDVVDRGRVPDRADDLAAALRGAARGGDAVLTTGGVSAGDADLVCGAITTCGELIVRRVAVRPGRPMAFGQIEGSWIFSLAGKPSGVLSGFLGIVGDALRRLGGEPPPVPRPRLPMVLAEPLVKRHARTEFVQGIMFERDGRWMVRPSRIEGGRLCSMSAANCYIVLGPEVRDLAAGQPVPVQVYGDRV